MPTASPAHTTTPGSKQFAAVPGLLGVQFTCHQRVDELDGWAIVYTSKMDSALDASEDGRHTYMPLPAQIEDRR